MNLKKYAPDTIDLLSFVFNQINNNRSYLTLAIKFNIFVSIICLLWLASFGLVLLPISTIFKVLFALLDFVLGFLLLLVIFQIFPVGFIDIVMNKKKPSFSNLIGSASGNIMFVVFLSLVSLGLGLVIPMLFMPLIFIVWAIDIFLPFFNLTALAGTIITAPLALMAGYIPVLMVFRYFKKKEPVFTLLTKSIGYVIDHFKQLYFVALGYFILSLCLGSMGLGLILLPFVLFLVIMPFLQVMSRLLIINFVSRNP